MSSFGASLNEVFLSNKSDDTVEVPAKRQKMAENAVDLEHYRERMRPNDGIVVMRGFLVYAFDCEDYSWFRLADCRRDRAYFEVALLKNELYAISTFNVLAAGTVEKYNFDINKWISLSDLPKKVRSVAACVAQDRLYVTGGMDLDALEATKIVYVLNNTKGKKTAIPAPGSNNMVVHWDVAGTLTNYRFRHACTTFEDKIWVVGGIVRSSPTVEESAKEEYSCSVEIFDPKTNKSTEGPSLRNPRAIDIGLLEVDGDLYVIGGDVPKNVTSVDGDAGAIAEHTIDRYDKQSHSWVQVTSFPIQRRGFSATKKDSKIYIFGGRNESEDVTTWDAFDVKAKTWDSQTLTGVNFSMPEMDGLYGCALGYSL